MKPTNRASFSEDAMSKSDWEKTREGFHATYNGGHESAECRAAFHHGMDTVFNMVVHEVWPSPALCKDSARMLELLREANVFLCVGDVASIRKKHELIGNINLFLARHADVEIEPTTGASDERVERWGDGVRTREASI